MLHNQLTNYLEEHNLLNDYQYGFRKGCGMEEAAVNVINYICLDDDGYSGVVELFLDLTKALYIIDHGILLEKLSLYGDRNLELDLFENYLRNRKQFV